MANKVHAGPYDAQYYEAQFGGSIRSARLLLPVLLNQIGNVERVVDFGCGRGAWLIAAGECGPTKLLGFDGDWVDPALMEEKGIDFRKTNFADVIELEDSFDLAICMEVAEHLSETIALNLVASICRSTDIALFGAAIPGQGGTDHINEKPQSYWVEQFDKNGFGCVDSIRPAIWTNKDIDVWYRQNALVYVRRDSALAQSGRFVLDQGSIFDVVHPELFTARQESLERVIEGKNDRLDRPSISELFGIAYRYGRNLLKVG